MLQKLVQFAVNSLGLKRRLSNLFQTLTLIITNVPGLAEYAFLLQAIASWLGIAGVGHAAVAKTLKVDLATVAAFFSALLLAAEQVPQLKPYAGTIRILAMFLGTLAAGSSIDNKKVTAPGTPSIEKLVKDAKKK